MAGSSAANVQFNVIHHSSLMSDSGHSAQSSVNNAQPSRTVQLTDTTPGVPLYRRPETSLQALMEAAPGQEPELSSEDLLSEDPRAAAIEDALACLTDRQREVFIAYHVEGLDLPAIGARFGVTKQAIAKTLDAARKKLAANLEHNPAITLHRLREIADLEIVGPRTRAAGRVLNARWQLARALSDIEESGLSLDEVSAAIGLDADAAKRLVFEFRNG